MPTMVSVYKSSCDFEPALYTLTHKSVGSGLYSVWRTMDIDQLDARIITLFTDNPRMSVLEASRGLSVARATVQSRLDRMQRTGVIAGWGPRIDPVALGYAVIAHCSLTIRQDKGHDAVVEALEKIPEIQEIHTVSGESDLMARVAARSNSDLQRVIDSMIATETIVRSSTVIVLNTHFDGRTLPLTRAAAGLDSP